MRHHVSCISLVGSLALALAAGCGGGPLGRTSAGLQVPNGAELNGVKLNGVKLNGVKLNGVKLNGSTLVGLDLEGLEIGGAALTGAELEGALSDGTVLLLRIDGVELPDGSGDDVVKYRVSYLSEAAWAPLCGTDSQGAAVEAIALAGTWSYEVGVPGGGAHTDDPEAFTFACEGSALAKCAKWGYRPWLGLARYHQACTRLVRADYCGDGRAATIDGTAVNLYDGIGINIDTERWHFEAEWDENGARCATSLRVATGETYGGSPKACMTELLEDTRCGSPSRFKTGALLMSEFDNWWTAWGKTKTGSGTVYH